MMNLGRPIREGVCACVCVCVCVFQICDEPESQHDGACLRYIMMNRNRHMKVVLKKYDEPESPNEGHA